MFERSKLDLKLWNGQNLCESEESEKMIQREKIYRPRDGECESIKAIVKIYFVVGWIVASSAMEIFTIWRKHASWDGFKMRWQSIELKNDQEDENEIERSTCRLERSSNFSEPFFAFLIEIRPNKSTKPISMKFHLFFYFVAKIVTWLFIRCFPSGRFLCWFGIDADGYSQYSFVENSKPFEMDRHPRQWFLNSVSIFILIGKCWKDFSSCFGWLPISATWNTLSIFALGSFSIRLHSLKRVVFSSLWKSFWVKKFFVSRIVCCQSFERILNMEIHFAIMPRERLFYVFCFCFSDS